MSAEPHVKLPRWRNEAWLPAKPRMIEMERDAALRGCEFAILGQTERETALVFVPDTALDGFINALRLRRDQRRRARSKWRRHWRRLWGR